MPTQQTVTAEYLYGVSSGRAILRATPGILPHEIERLIDTCTDLLRRGFSREIADTYRGERDFWKNQLKLRKIS